MDFDKLKRRSKGEELKRLQKHIRFGIGTHKNKKLRQALGSRARSTLLDEGVSKTHSARLLKQFLWRWGNLKKEDAQDRLKLWTVLDSVVALDEEKILSAVDSMRARLDAVCRQVKGIEVIGAVEIEIVNIKKMKQLSSTVDEARKLNVILSLIPVSEKSLFAESHDTWALVHFHGVVDLGSNADAKLELLRESAKRWWSDKFQVQLKPLHEDKTLRTSLTNIARYLVKGGNENLIYKIGFGWDAAENLERQMLKSGKSKLGLDFEGFTNEMSLTMDEVRVLGTVVDRMMGRTGSKNMRNGYLFKHGQHQK